MLNRLQDVFRSFQHHDVRYIVSREDLIRSKRAAGREIDMEDIHLLATTEPPDQPPPESH